MFGIAQECASLENGQKIPLVGFGTWPMKEDECYDAVLTAIRAGYRHIDTAFHYGNEADVGRAINDAIKQGLVKRDEIFLTSKLADHHKDPGVPKRAVNRQLKTLNMEYIDLYLIHSPWSLVPTDDPWEMAKKTSPDGTLEMADIPITDTWKELEALVDDGKIKGLGVSNFSEEQIGNILKKCKHRPQMNQVECHPLLSQLDLISYCHQNRVHITAYSPLGSNSRNISGTKNPLDLLHDDRLLALSQKYEKSVAQILLKFQISRGVLVIPKSAQKARIESNFQLMDWTLEKDDILLLAEMNQNLRGWTEERVKHSKYFPW